MWPPKGIEPLNPFSVPLLNTAVLLSSGATVTWAHHAIISGQREEAIRGLTITVVLGIIFTGLQAMEYYEAPFAISDSVYGATCNKNFLINYGYRIRFSTLHYFLYIGLCSFF